MDENRMQIIPPGFHLIYLPFADDFRQIDRKITAKCKLNFLFKI